MQVGPFIAWVLVAAIAAGSLWHLLTRPHLRGDQKLVTLLVSLAISVPLAGLLMVPLYFVMWVLWWDHGISDATAEVIFFGPPAVLVGIAILCAGIVADRMESGKASQEIDGSTG